MSSSLWASSARPAAFLSHSPREQLRNSSGPSADCAEVRRTRTVTQLAALTVTLPLRTPTRSSVRRTRASRRSAARVSARTIHAPSITSPWKTLKTPCVTATGVPHTCAARTGGSKWAATDDLKKT